MKIRKEAVAIFLFSLFFNIPCPQILILQITRVYPALSFIVVTTLLYFTITSTNMSHTIKIYHNPKCGTSRNTLALIRNSGQEPIIIEYLETPPTKQELVDLIKGSGLGVRDVIRSKEQIYKTLKMDEPHWSDDELIDLMLENPILINRPFVVTEKGVKFCRPSELVLDILPTPQQKPFAKEDGEVIIDDNLQRVK